MTKYFSRFLSSMIYFLIQAYRYSLAYFLGGQCRFTPTCSTYALDAIKAHGPVKGTQLAVSRICRCHPWGGAGFDPAPKAENG